MPGKRPPVNMRAVNRLVRKESKPLDTRVTHPIAEVNMPELSHRRRKREEQRGGGGGGGGGGLGSDGRGGGSGSIGNNSTKGKARGSLGGTRPLSANVKRSNETKPGGLSSLGNLGLRSVNTMPPELRRMAHKLSDAQLQELARRIRDRVAIISESLEVQYHKRRQKLDANGVFDVDINKSRTEAMHHVAIQRRLRPGDLEGEVLREMLAEEHYRKLLTESVDDLEGKMNKWFMGTEFQNLTAAGRNSMEPHKKQEAVLGPRFAGAFARKWGRGAKQRVALKHIIEAHERGQSPIKAVGTPPGRASVRKSALGQLNTAGGGSMAGSANAGTSKDGSNNSPAGSQHGGDSSQGKGRSLKQQGPAGSMHELMRAADRNLFFTGSEPRPGSPPVGRGRFANEVNRGQRRGHRKGMLRANTSGGIGGVGSGGGGGAGGGRDRASVGKGTARSVSTHGGSPRAARSFTRGLKAKGGARQAPPQLDTAAMATQDGASSSRSGGGGGFASPHGSSRAGTRTHASVAGSTRHRKATSTRADGAGSSSGGTGAGAGAGAGTGAEPDLASVVPGAVPLTGVGAGAGVVLPPNTKEGRAAEAQATRKWAQQQGIVAGDVDGTGVAMDAAAAAGGAGPSGSGGGSSGGGGGLTAGGADLEDMIAQEKAMREMFNATQVDGAASFRLGTRRGGSASARRKAASAGHEDAWGLGKHAPRPDTSVPDRRSNLLSLTGFKRARTKHRKHLLSRERIQSRRRARQASSYGQTANGITGDLLSARQREAGTFGGVPTKIRTRALGAGRTTVSVPRANPLRPVSIRGPAAVSNRVMTPYIATRPNSSPAGLSALDSSGRIRVTDMFAGAFAGPTSVTGKTVLETAAHVGVLRGGGPDDPFRDTPLMVMAGTSASGGTPGGGGTLAVNEEALARLVDLWHKLEVPAMQRFDFMCKYSQPQYAATLLEATSQWEEAVKVVSVREKVMQVWRRFEQRRKRNEGRAIASAASSRRGSVASRVSAAPAGVSISAPPPGITTGGMAQLQRGRRRSRARNSSALSQESVTRLMEAQTKAIMPSGADGVSAHALSQALEKARDEALNSALTPEDQNYLISKECWVDRGQLEGEDRSTRAQVRAILNRLDLLCTRIAETLLKSFGDTLTYRGADYVKIIKSRSCEQVRHQDNKAMQRFGDVLLTDDRVDPAAVV